MPDATFEQRRRDVRHRADVLGVFLSATRSFPPGRFPDDAWFDVEFAAYQLRRAANKLRGAGTPSGPPRADIRRPW